MVKKRKDTVSKGIEKECPAESGIATVEAIISLTIFLFAFMAIYSIISLCIVQAKIQTALNISAKEVSQYTYFYYKFHVDDLTEQLKAKGENAAGVFEAFNKALSGTEAAVGSVEGAVSNVSAESVQNAVNSVKALSADVDMLKATIKEVGENPAEYIKSFAALALSDLEDNIKTELAAYLAKEMSRKHFDGMSLEKMGVAGGFDKMYFDKSKLLQGEQNKNDVYLAVVYELKLADWLPFDLSVTISQSARTRGWAGK